MSKLSKFTFHCTNNEGDLLLFNSYHGVKSICKIKNRFIQAQLIEGRIDNAEIIEKLMNKGILVSNETNEQTMLNHMIGRVLFPSDLGLNISPTEYCNFRCKYCYEKHNSIKMNSTVQNDIIAFVRANMKNYSKLNVSWFGGEPLLAVDQIKVLSEAFMNTCQFYKRKYTSTMTTNGYLLNVELFKQLLDLRVSGYQISIDGLRDTHDNQRPLVNGSNTFNVIIDNLKKIKALRNRNFHIVIRSNITFDIYEKLDEYIDLLSYFCDGDSRFSVLIQYAAEWSDGIEPEFKKRFLRSQDDILPIFQKILNAKKKINFTFNLNPDDGSCQLGRANRYFIRPNGEIHQCTVCFENPQNITGMISDGKLKLNSTYYDRLLNPNMCPNLYECFYAPICKGEVCPSKRKKQTFCPDSKVHLNYYLQLMDNYESFEQIDK